MADEEHVALLRMGVKVWNERHIMDFGVHPDLSGADFRGENLSKVDLSGADLRGADLSEADLR